MARFIEVHDAPTGARIWLNVDHILYFREAWTIEGEEEYLGHTRAHIELRSGVLSLLDVRETVDALAVLIHTEA